MRSCGMLLVVLVAVLLVMVVMAQPGNPPVIPVGTLSYPPFVGTPTWGDPAAPLRPMPTMPAFLITPEPVLPEAQVPYFVIAPVIRIEPLQHWLRVVMYVIHTLDR